MMKKLAILILAIIVFCYGCKKDNRFDFFSSLIGKWSWFISCGGTGTACWTPASRHTSINLVFTSDSIFKVYQNDTLRASCIFHTYKSISEDGKYISYIIKYDSGGTEMFSITHDTLSLVNSDGILTIVSRYKRIK
jgi:hypothetical protein